MTATTTATKATVTSVNITNNPEARAALDAFRAAKAAIKAAEAAKVAAEATLRETLGEAREAIILGQRVLKVSSLRTRVSIDAKGLLEAFPEAYAATAKVSTYDFLQEA
jgi:hypothetical protein